MKTTVRDWTEAHKRTHPLRSPAHAGFMYAKPTDLNKRGATVVVWIVLWSDDGRTSMHQTKFEKARPMSVQEWAGWLRVNAPHVLRGAVLGSLNRTFGTTWNIDRVFGWHFVGRTRAGRK